MNIDIDNTLPVVLKDLEKLHEDSKSIGEIYLIDAFSMRVKILRDHDETITRRIEIRNKSIK
jgi:hypothetical protein